MNAACTNHNWNASRLSLGKSIGAGGKSIGAGTEGWPSLKDSQKEVLSVKKTIFSHFNKKIYIFNRVNKNNEIKKRYMHYSGTTDRNPLNKYLIEKSKKIIKQKNNKFLWNNLNQRTSTFLTTKNNIDKINKCHFHTRNPEEEYIMARMNPTTTAENLSMLEKELLRVSTIVAECLQEGKPLSYFLMENQKIGYALKPEFIINYLKILLKRKEYDHSLLLDLDDVGLLTTDDSFIIISSEWKNNYQDFRNSHPINASTQLPSNFKKDAAIPDTETDSTNGFEWNWKKIAVIVFFGLYIMKEVIEYFYYKNQNKKDEGVQPQDKKTEDMPKEKSGNEEGLKSIYEDMSDPVIMEILLKIVVPYNLYMVYKFRYYIYYKYFNNGFK